MDNHTKAAEPADDLYFVVHNEEKQYSIWRSDKPLPTGWVSVGPPALKEDCLARIKVLWTDMRPASLQGS
jgi:MbtH protein